MSYYTCYTLDVTVKDKHGHNHSVLDVEKLEEIARAICAISSDFDEDNLREGSDDPLGDMISSDCMKWYDHTNDLVKVSRRFPQYYFCLEGHGEDWNDIWREYFHDGGVFIAPVRMEFDEPNWGYGVD